jgi:hypothetical protein
MTKEQLRLKGILSFNKSTKKGEKPFSPHLSKIVNNVYQRFNSFSTAASSVDLSTPMALRL